MPSFQDVAVLGTFVELSEVLFVDLSLKYSLYPNYSSTGVISFTAACLDSAGWARMLVRVKLNLLQPTESLDFGLPVSPSAIKLMYR